jgi:DNA processing protein
MALDPERVAFVSLALTPGIGWARLRALLDRCETAHGALKAPFEFLCTVPGISRAAATTIVERGAREGRKALLAARTMGARCILRGDPEFPPLLRDIPDSPPLLFAMGDLSLLDRPAVAIVGSRDHSDYGAATCHAAATAAAGAGIAVVSGMARGLDALAHLAALDAGGPTIGILGNGLGVVYPAANRALYRRVADHGLLLTEFPPGERPGVGAFPRRNRLISALARVTLVIEAAEASGTLITVGTALAQGKDVMALPGPITSPTSAGTNRLIRDGAEPYLGVEDLLAHYPEVAAGADHSPAPSSNAHGEPVQVPEDLDADERVVFLAVASSARPLDDLIAELSLGAGRTLSAISRLELAGLVVMMGSSVARCRTPVRTGP